MLISFLIQGAIATLYNQNKEQKKRLQSQASQRSVPAISEQVIYSRSQFYDLQFVTDVLTKILKDDYILKGYNISNGTNTTSGTNRFVVKEADNEITIAVLIHGFVNHTEREKARKRVKLIFVLLPYLQQFSVDFSTEEVYVPLANGSGSVLI